MEKIVRASFVWLILACAAVLGGCASPGMNTVKSGNADDQRLLARVVAQTDVQVTKSGVDVPIAIVRAHQVGFVDTVTNKLIPVPDGRGGTMELFRTAFFDTTDTTFMRFGPAAFSTLLGVVGQGEYGLKQGRQQARLNAECVKAGTCLQGPSTVVNAVAGSTSQSLIEGVALQTLINLGGCAAAGNCPPPVPSTPPPTPSGPPPAGGN